MWPFCIIIFYDLQQNIHYLLCTDEKKNTLGWTLSPQRELTVFF